MTNCCRLFCLVAAGFGLACSSDDPRTGNDAAADTALAPDTKLSPDTGPGDGGSDTTTVAPDAGDAGNDGSHPDLQSPDAQNPDLRADGPLTSARSFIVEGKLVARPANPGVGPLPSVDAQIFSLRLDPQGKTVTLGVAGSANRVSVTSADGQTFAATAPLKSFVTTGYFPCGAPQLTLDKFSVQVGGDVLQGTAEGRMDVLMGDAIYGYAVAMTMTGRPDNEGPSFGADLKDDIDPLAGLYLKSSEPLPAATTAALTSAADTRVDLEAFSPMDATGVVTGFHFKAGRILRYDTSYDLVVTPGSDLAGNARVLLPKLQTLPAPALAAEDGFESAGTTLGGAKVVQAPLLPPVSGSRSIFIASGISGSISVGRRFTVRLAVAAGDKTVRFSLRSVFQYQQTAFPYGNAIRVATPGGSIVAASLPGAETPTVRHETGTDNPLWLGKKVELEVALPSDAKTEVVFDAAVGPGEGCGLLAPVPGYLIDDLRVE